LLLSLTNNDDNTLFNTFFNMVSWFKFMFAQSNLKGIHMI